MENTQKSNFARLIGLWKTTGIIKTEHDDLNLVGVDSYEWMLNGQYILHKADVKMGKEKSETFEIIKPDEKNELATMHYFNSNGEDGTMNSKISNGIFEINGDGLKFHGSIDKENKSIVGKWYSKNDKDEWVEFIELNLEKQQVKRL